MIVLVVGSGRSGTSTVARLLHENLGIHMGGPWKHEPNIHNPKGFYEDSAFGDTLKMVMAPYPYPDIIKALQNLIDHRAKHYPRWGIKANSLCYCLPKFVELLPEEPIIIRCERQLGKVVDSWVRTWQDMSFKEAAFECAVRAWALDEYEYEIYGLNRITFNYHRTDEALLGELRGIIQ